VHPSGARAQGDRNSAFLEAPLHSNHALPVAKNVIDRKFEVDAPDVAWVTDITYIWTAKG
jgi:transposase InsO family protein